MNEPSLSFRRTLAESERRHLRDECAKIVLKEYLRGWAAGVPSYVDPKGVAKTCWAIADQMLLQRDVTVQEDES